MEAYRVEANGIMLAVEDYGLKDAVPLILIRGQGSQMAHWPRELIDGFVAAGYRTVTFDNRDVGLSQQCPVLGVAAEADTILSQLEKGEPLVPPYQLEDMAEDVTGLMDALGLEKTHLFGISMGGMITQQVVIQAPERLLSATIVMSSCRPTSEWAAGDQIPLIDQVSKILSRPMTRVEYVTSQLEEHAAWGSPGFPMDPDEIRAMAEVAYDRGTDAEGKNRQFLAVANASDRRALLSTSTVPCFVIHGEDDTLIPLRMGQEIAATVPGSEFFAVSGMGHIVTPALAPLIVERVAAFISLKENGAKS